MISRRRLLGTIAAPLGTAIAAGAVPAAGAAEGRRSPGGSLRVTEPTVEYVRNPLGLDTPAPRMSWPLAADLPGREQTAYQVRVATAPQRLPEPDVWDSGKIASERSVLVPYAGPALRARTRYYWSVRVWDDTGAASAWSVPSWWETGLTGASDWSARWIGAPEALGAPKLDGASWIWFPEGDPASNAPAATRWFRGRVEVPAGVTRARLVMTADDGYTAYADGVEVSRAEPDGPAEGWRRPAVVDLTGSLGPGAGSVVIAVAAVNATESPAGLLGLLELTTADGVRTYSTDATWKTTAEEPPDDWRTPGYADGSWSAAAVLAPWGAGPWGKVMPAHSPATQLRHEFRIPRKKIARARLYSTALGVYEAYLNGERVGEDRLAPGWTDYRKRVQYQTYDVTALLKSGANAFGATLAPGWYAGNIAWFGSHQYGGEPAFLAQLEITYTDGTTGRVLSGTDWRVVNGPVTGADLLMGEEYDARLETKGWTGAGFDDSAWLPAAEGAEVTAGLVAEAGGPTRVERELSTRKVTEPEPGVFVFDLGQNMVGAVRLTVSGAAGTTVRLRHAEVLNPDGTIYTANLRTGPRHGHVHTQGRRNGDVRAAVHLPRLPLRGGDRLSRHSPALGRDRARHPHIGALHHGLHDRLAPAQPVAPQHHLGPARQLPVRAHRHSRTR